jgi:hypothetical protein
LKLVAVADFWQYSVMDKSLDFTLPKKTCFNALLHPYASSHVYSNTTR